MQKANKAHAEIIAQEMIDLAKLVMKYSPSQLEIMITAVDLDSLQRDMIANGATKDEIRESSECHHDIWETMCMFGICD